jgi:hypothetical protein
MSIITRIATLFMMALWFSAIAQGAGHPLTKSPDATVLFHGRLSDAKVLEIVAGHAGVALPSDAMEQFARLIGQQVSSTSCLVLRTSLLEKMIPECQTFGVVVFYGRNVDFDRDIDLDLVSARVLALDKNNRLFFAEIPKKGNLTPEEIKRRGLNYVVPFVEVRRK